MISRLHQPQSLFERLRYTNEQVVVISRTCTLCVTCRTVEAQGETVDTAKTTDKRSTGRYAQTTRLSVRELYSENWSTIYE
jgi:hypothetical protein